jgi:hypothetical protein
LNFVVGVEQHDTFFQPLDDAAQLRFAGMRLRFRGLGYKRFEHHSSQCPPRNIVESDCLQSHRRSVAQMQFGSISVETVFVLR